MVRGRPGARFALPSYFLAINFRCQANNVSGVTTVATSARSFLPSRLGLCRKSAALVIVESDSPVADLCSKHAILFHEVFDDMLLVLFQPATATLTACTTISAGHRRRVDRISQWVTRRWRRSSPAAAHRNRQVRRDLPERPARNGAMAKVFSVELP